MTTSQIVARAVAILIFEAVVYPESAEAYIGPAIAFAAYLLAPLAAIFGAVAILLYRPVKSLMRWRRRNAKTENSGAAKQDTE